MEEKSSEQSLGQVELYALEPSVRGSWETMKCPRKISWGLWSNPSILASFFSSIARRPTGLAHLEARSFLGIHCRWRSSCGWVTSAQFLPVFLDLLLQRSPSESWCAPNCLFPTLMIFLLLSHSSYSGAAYTLFLSLLTK